MKIGILAGEASGDLLGAKLIHALRERCPGLEIEGIAGPAMIAAGCKSLYDIEQLSIMGLIEPIVRLPQLIKLRRNLYQHFIQHRPDLFIGIDAPDFNLGLELKLHHAGIPTVHYVSPSIWAWRQNRVHKIAKAVDLMLTLLPFEAKFYEQHNIPVRYAGHPLAQQMPLENDTKAARRKLCIDEDATYVALLPGSRQQEIRYLAESFLQAAKLVLAKKPNVRFLTAHVNESRYQEFYDYFKKYAPDLPLDFFTQRSHDVMAAADVVVVTSGTATLETMLCKKPMIIAYRMSPVTHFLAKILVKTPYIGLPNLLANQLLVPELIQNAATADAIAQHIINYLDQPEKTNHLINQFTALHHELLSNSTKDVIDNILKIVNTNN